MHNFFFDIYPINQHCIRPCINFFGANYYYLSKTLCVPNILISGDNLFPDHPRVRDGVNVQRLRQL